MRLVFFGSGEFAVPILEVLSAHVEFVVSQPDRPSGRKMVPTPTPVSKAAVDLDLPLATPDKCRSTEFVQKVKDLNPDALVVASYGQILPQVLLDAAKFGGINLHGSVLPAWRGAAPIQWSIREGTGAGVTLMQMDKGMDTGDIIDAVPIRFDGPWKSPTYGDLESVLGRVGADLAVEWLPRIVVGEYTRHPQDHSAATYAPKLGPEHLAVRFDMEAWRVFCACQAASPRPGIRIHTSHGTLKLWKLSRAEMSGEPGTVLESGKRLVVGFGDEALVFEEVQQEGKTRMSGADLARGLRIALGTSLLP